MLEAEQGGEDEARCEEGGLRAREDEGEDEGAVEKAVVLEVNMVDDEEAWGEEDGDGGGVGGALICRGRVDEPVRVRSTRGSPSSL